MIGALEIVRIVGMDRLIFFAGLKVYIISWVLSRRIVGDFVGSDVIFTHVHFCSGEYPIRDGDGVK